MNFTNFSEIIKQKRIAKGLLQKEMALKVPIQKARYNRIENGLLEPTFIELQAICRILEIVLTEVLELKKPIREDIFFD
jgi:transcriptional regulator with XRE-family HTH domain